MKGGHREQKRVCNARGHRIQMVGNKIVRNANERK